MLRGMEWKEEQDAGETIMELQEALSSGDTRNKVEVSQTLARLQQKLLKIQSWGEPYSGIEFSPPVQALINQQKTPTPSIQELPAPLLAAAAQALVS